MSDTLFGETEMGDAFKKPNMENEKEYTLIQPEPVLWEWQVFGDDLLVISFTKPTRWSARLVTSWVMGSKWIKEPK